MKHFIYVLLSLKNSHLYVGYTNNLERWLNQHNKGRVNSTKPYLPYRLIYKEEFFDKQKAIQREKELKSSKGRRYLKQFIN